MDESRAVFLVNWELGGELVSLRVLEVGNLRVCNKALLAKILWWFPRESSFYIRVCLGQLMRTLTNLTGQLA